MKEANVSAAQKAAAEKLKILMNECAFATKPSFLYTQSELLKIFEKDLTKLDNDYIKKFKIPPAAVKDLAKSVYEALMEKGEYDKAIVFASHYKL